MDGGRGDGEKEQRRAEGLIIPLMVDLLRTIYFEEQKINIELLLKWEHNLLH